MKIIYGSGNKAKVEKVVNFFKANKINIEILSLKDIGFDREIIEDGKTFEENSLIKAKAIKEFCEEKKINEIIVIVIPWIVSVNNNDNLTPDQINGST